MLSLLDPLRGVTLLSVAVRMLLSALCGGLVGIEREFKRRSAGFRTHILICVGASMTTMTSQYLLGLGYYTDIARLGAQVIAGVGFIGAGAIIVTRSRRVKGLTTAAGLWTAAIVGLAFGAGFYEGGIVTTVLILLAELVFSKLERRMLSAAPIVNLYLEYQDRSSLDAVLQKLKSCRVKVISLEITRAGGEPDRSACAIFVLQLDKKLKIEALLASLRETQGVIGAEEL